MSFGFPKRPASRTVISHQPSEEEKADAIIKYAKDVLQKVKNVLSSIEIAMRIWLLKICYKKLG